MRGRSRSWLATSGVDGRPTAVSPSPRTAAWMRSTAPAAGMRKEPGGISASPALNGASAVFTARSFRRYRSVIMFVEPRWATKYTDGVRHGCPSVTRTLPSVSTHDGVGQPRRDARAASLRGIAYAVLAIRRNIRRKE